MTETAKGNYAEVNGINLYYEIHGSGEPLVLLHGGVATIDLMFSAVMPALAGAHKVIAVELQAHGHTADVDRPMRYEHMADDITALLDHLGIESANLMGYSLGGGVALQTAIRHPEKVRKLVLVSTAFAREGWYPEVLAGMGGISAAAAEPMKQSPFYEPYTAVAPRPEDWPVLLEKLGELLRRDYDWSVEVATVKAPTLIVVGDGDSIQLPHAVAMFGLLGGGKADGGQSGRPASQLAVLPDTLHWNILFRADVLLPVVMPFLAGGK